MRFWKKFTRLRIFLSFLFLLSSVAYLSFSQVPLDLDEWAYEYNDFNLTIHKLGDKAYHFYTMELDDLIIHVDEFDGNYDILMEKDLSHNKYRYPDGIVKIKFSFSLHIIIDQENLDNTTYEHILKQVNYSIYANLKEPINYTHHNFELRTFLYGIDGWIKNIYRGYISARVLININEIKNVLSTDDSYVHISINFALFIHKMGKMHVLVGQGVVSLLIALMLFLDSLMVKSESNVEGKWLIYTIIAIIIIVMGNIAHLYLWYKIANMPVGYTMYDGEIAMIAFIFPFWSSGPWWKFIPADWLHMSLKYHEPLFPNYKIVPNPYLGYTTNYIILIQSLTFLTTFLLILGTFLLLLSIAGNAKLKNRYASYGTKSQESSIRKFP